LLGPQGEALSWGQNTKLSQALKTSFSIDLLFRDISKFDGATHLLIYAIFLAHKRIDPKNKLCSAWHNFGKIFCPKRQAKKKKKYLGPSIPSQKI